VLWLGLVGDHLLVQTEEPFGLSALRPATGKVQWSTGELEGGFAADNAHVYFAGSDVNSGETMATAFRLDNGVPAWSRPIGPSHKVIVGHGDIFIGGSSAVTFQPVVRVLDSSSGAFRYRLKDSSVAAYQPGAVYTMDSLRHTIIARHPRTGRAIWSRTHAKSSALQVMLANGVAYTAWIFDSSSSINYSLRAYRAADGKLILKRAGYDDVKAVTGGTVYASGGGLDALRPRRH
jgi:outer membrane protein assembly factor BamB